MGDGRRHKLGVINYEGQMDRYDKAEGIFREMKKRRT